jgi:hypothetical protein
VPKNTTMTFIEGNRFRLPRGYVQLACGEYRGYPVQRCVTNSSSNARSTSYCVLGDRLPRTLQRQFATEAMLQKAIDAHLDTRSIAA